jgi:glycosyltransferase involved in cell wall biosynthesis
LPDGTSAVLGRIRSCPSFLSVGTVEPRKGYAQELAAFDLLWQQGREVCLVIIGSQGWLVDDLAVRLRNHPELNRHLFWLETISDQYLETLYAACTCLLAVSEAEGFGLPLVEAARHKLPVIARDIPVFREIMGAHAFYFSGQEPDSIAVTVDRWLSLRREGKQPKSDTLRWTTWKESAKRLQAIVVGDDCYITIAPTERRT